MSKQVQPGGVVVGVEIDPAQLQRAVELARAAGDAALVDFRVGNAAALPLSETETGSFDLVHARFVLEHVPDPLTVVRQMVRAARPGGRIVLQDDDHELLRLWPELPGFDRIWHSYMTAFERNHNDPRIGRRLVQLLSQAGAQPTRNTSLFFGSCAGTDTWITCTDNLRNVIDTLVPAMLRHQLVSRAEYEKFILAFQAWRNRTDAAMWYGISYAEGRRP
jgi:SAM-dependent methyltransferase